MPPSERPSPRITVNDLALYLVSSPTAQIGIVRRSKFPNIPPLIRYKDVRQIVVSYLSDIGRNVQALVTAEGVFTQRSQDSSQSALRQDDARQSIEVLHSLQGMQNQLAAIRFTPAPKLQTSLSISGVEVATRLDLFSHGATKGVEQVGGAVLRLTQDDAETATAKARRREMGLYVATVARVHIEQSFSTTAQIANRLCMAIDIRHGEVFAAPASSTRRIADIENACRFIAALWPTLM